MAKPLPPERAGAPGDICRELLPPKALAGLTAAGVRTEGTPRAVVVPLSPPGVTGSTATEGCSIQIEGSPVEAAVVRRLFDDEAITLLKKGLQKTTDEVGGAPTGWELRWSDAASTAFAFAADESRAEAYVVQVVLQRPGLNRRQLVVGLARNVLPTIASQR